MRQFRLLKLVAIAAFAAFGLSACATSRSVVAIAEPSSPPPNSTHFVKITEVRDLRQFSVNPSDPSKPSLGNQDEIQDPKITARAVARKRNTYGMALGDVVVGETTSVAALVRAATRQALQDRGYVVVDESSPDYAGAPGLTIDIDQFWAWMQPGFTALTFTFNSGIGLKGGTMLVTDPSFVSSQTVVTSAFGTESIWIQTIQNGLKDLTEQMKVHIKAPAGAPLVSRTEDPAAPSESPGS